MKRIKDFLKSQKSKEFAMNGIQVADKVGTMMMAFVVYVFLFFLLILLINYMNIGFISKPHQLVLISGFIYFLLKFCLKIEKDVENRSNNIKNIIIETFAITYLFMAFIFKTMLPTVTNLYNIFVLCFLVINAIDRLHKILHS
ncbi:TPA: hypothetical protein U0611_001147 [Streptococcus suis]|uniref:CpsV n=1 Tax=Streptococcus suis TaxID=1307 RepID=A0A1P8VRD3_STRSU|nr:cpsV [Streptococcus suis]APZ79277.1 cpsV [Streptococcus suis]HEM2786815.1 hypothetical protein [Streptococcus suis]